MVVPGIQSGRDTSAARPLQVERDCAVACLFFCALLAAVPAACAQGTVPAPNPQDAPSAPPPTAAVHGIVKNAVTGEPLARVLVRVETRSDTGALTDGDGRFEIPDVPIGNAVIDLVKPGFGDALQAEDTPTFWQANRGVPHPVTVAEGTPDLEFAMRPLNAIRGLIELSSGDSAEKISVELLRQTVVDGRLAWQQDAVAETNADGAYRFGELPDGVYAVMTTPSMDGDNTGRLPAGGAAPQVRTGYARSFYSDSRDLAGAARIRLTGGQTVQANLTLRQEGFHLVRATLSGAGLEAIGGGTRLGGGAIIAQSGTSITLALSGFEPQVLDIAGHATGYPARYDSQSHTVQSMLPDGDYTLRVTAFRPSRQVVTQSGSQTIVTRVQNFLSGQTDVSVNGHPVINLRVALGPDDPAPLLVTVNRTGDEAPPQTESPGPDMSGVFISVTQAGNTADPMNSQFAQGGVPGTLETSPLAPGAYWLHTTVAQPGLCEASFTAGGANLAREPLVVGQSGSTAPLTLTLRDDCAALKLNVPLTLAPNQTGEEPLYYVYVIPDFDSTTEVRAQMLRPGMMNTTTMENLTPGAYHVYTLERATDLPFRDPDAMTALNLQGQAITLSPGDSASLTLEAPAK